MNTKVITWIALVISLAALGIAVFFWLRPQDASTGVIKQSLAAAGTCHLVDGTDFGVNSVEACKANQNWLKWVSLNGATTIENPNPAGSGEPDPDELGTCFINYNSSEYYVDTFTNCLNDPTAYAFCTDENASSPEGCEYISSLPGDDTKPL